MLNHERTPARRLAPPRWGRVDDLLYAVTKTPEYQEIVDGVKSQGAEQQLVQESNAEEWGVHLIESLPSALRAGEQLLLWLQKPYRSEWGKPTNTRAIKLAN